MYKYSAGLQEHVQIFSRFTRTCINIQQDYMNMYKYSAGLQEHVQIFSMITRACLDIHELMFRYRLIPF